MEFDVIISNDDGVSLHVRNIVCMNLSDTDSSINSLLSAIDSDSNDSTGSHISSHNRNDSHLISHMNSSPDCEMLKFPSGDKINKITCRTNLKPEEAIRGGLKKKIDTNNLKEMTDQTSIKNCQTMNILSTSGKKTLQKSIHSSPSNNLSGISVKSNKGMMSLPINQDLVVCTAENELKTESIKSLMKNEIVRCTSNQSDKKKVRQVFPTKITKSRLSNIMDELDVSSEKPQRDNKPKKKLKENSFEVVRLPSIHSVNEVKDQLNLLSNSDAQKSFKHKKKSNMLTSQANESRNKYLSNSKLVNTENNVEKKKTNTSCAHAETLKSNAVSENVHICSDLHISGSPRTFDRHKYAASGKQIIKSVNEQMPKTGEVNYSEIEPEIFNVSNPIDKVKRLKLDKPGPYLNVANSGVNHSAHNIPSSPETFYDNSDICKVVSNVTKFIPNYSGDFVEPLNLSQEMLKEKLGLVSKNEKSHPIHSSFKKKEANTKEYGEFYNLVSRDILPASSTLALQKLIDLFELVILSKDHLGFISHAIETLLSLTIKCKDSNNLNIFETLAEKSTLAAFKMCKFILDKRKQSLLPGPKMDNVELSLKAIESILSITNINSKLNMKFVADATVGMSEVEVFLFVRTIIDCKGLPIPKLNELQPFCSKVKGYATITAVPEKKYNVEKAPEFHTSLNMTVDPQDCDLTNEKVKVNNKVKLRSTSIAVYNGNNKFKEHPDINKSSDNTFVAQNFLKETPLSAKPIYGNQNMQNTSTHNDFSNCLDEPKKTSNSVIESVSPTFTREQLEKIVESFHCFDENIQSAIKGYLLELSQTPENANYAQRLLCEVKKLS